MRGVGDVVCREVAGVPRARGGDDFSDAKRLVVVSSYIWNGRLLCHPTIADLQFTSLNSCL